MLEPALLQLQAHAFFHKQYRKGSLAALKMTSSPSRMTHSFSLSSMLNQSLLRYLGCRNQTSIKLGAKRMSVKTKIPDGESKVTSSFPVAKMDYPFATAIARGVISASSIISSLRFLMWWVTPESIIQHSGKLAEYTSPWHWARLSVLYYSLSA